MNHPINVSLVNIIIEFAALVATGTLFLSVQILNPHNTIFSYTIFGLTAIILFNSLQYQGKRVFIYLAPTLMLVSLMAWFKIGEISLLVRDVLWFVLISVATFMSWSLLKKSTTSKINILPIVIWVIAGVIVYFLMTMMNIYVFGAYRLNDVITSGYYISQALKFGSTLGAGIGAGVAIVYIYRRSDR
jgi:hypothetical protein